MNSDSPINKQVVSQKGGVIDPAEAPWLPIADTLHDFGHTGDRNAIGALGALFTKANLMSPAQWADKLSKGSIDSASLVGKMGGCNAAAAKEAVSFERRVTAGMDGCALENAFTKAITWEDIINAPSAKYLAQSMVENICVLQNGPNAAFAYGRALRERGGKVQGSPLTRIAARNKVAHFILEFMFPGYTNESVGVTYDAAGAKITKIFSNIGQVKAVITPTNVADSASTMLDPYQDFKQYGHKRTEFIFPQSDAEAKSLEPWTYDINSTFFLSKLRKDAAPAILLHDENFNVNNPNGFKIQIAAGGEVTVNYDTWDKNVPTGPSAPYLATALKKRSWSNARKTTPNTSTIIPLGQWMGNAEHWKAMLVDIKRTGDYEQVNAAVAAQKMMPNLKLILGTGDTLCSTYARLQEQACILGGLGGGGDGEGGHALVLFRFPKKIDPDVEKRIEKARAIRLVKEHQKFILDNTEAIKLAQQLIPIMNAYITLFEAGLDENWPASRLPSTVIQFVNKLLPSAQNIFYYWVFLLSKIIGTELKSAVTILTNAITTNPDPNIQAQALKKMLEHQKISDHLINVFTDAFITARTAAGAAAATTAMRPPSPSKQNPGFKWGPNTKPGNLFMKKIGFNITLLKNTIKKINDFIIRFPALKPDASERRIGSAKRTAERYITTFINDKWGLPLSELFSALGGTTWGTNCFQNSLNDRLADILTSINGDAAVAAGGGDAALAAGAATHHVSLADFEQRVRLIAAQTALEHIGRSRETFGKTLLTTAASNCGSPNAVTFAGKSGGGKGKGKQVGGAGARAGPTAAAMAEAYATFFTNINDTIELIASRCNDILIERMNSKFKKDGFVTELTLGAYSIFYNLYKVLDRWFNATTTISVEWNISQRLIVVPPGGNDFLDSMLGIKQQAQWWERRWHVLQEAANAVRTRSDKVRAAAAGHAATALLDTQLGLKKIIERMAVIQLHFRDRGVLLRGTRVTNILRKVFDIAKEEACPRGQTRNRDGDCEDIIMRVLTTLRAMVPHVLTDKMKNIMREPLVDDVVDDLRNIWINQLWNHIDTVYYSIGEEHDRGQAEGGDPIVSSDNFLARAGPSIDYITKHLNIALSYNLVGFSRLYNRLQFNFMSFDIISTPSKQFGAELASRFTKQNPYPLPQDPATIAAQTNIVQVIQTAVDFASADTAETAAAARAVHEQSDNEAAALWGNPHYRFYIVDLPSGEENISLQRAPLEPLTLGLYNLSSSLQMYSFAPRNGNSAWARLAPQGNAIQLASHDIVEQAMKIMAVTQEQEEEKKAVDAAGGGARFLDKLTQARHHEQQQQAQAQEQAAAALCLTTYRIGPNDPQYPECMEKARRHLQQQHHLVQQSHHAMSDGGGKRAHTKKRRRRRRNTKRRGRRKQSKRRKRKQKKFTRRRKKRVKKRRRKRRYRRGTTRKRHR